MGSKEKELVDRLLSTTGYLACDAASGSTRYFGPTTSLHVYSDLGLSFKREGREQARRVERALQSLNPDTHDHLLDLFWTHYNSVFRLAQRPAFESDRDNGGTKYYSGFLHLCMLAMGFRFADRTKPGIQWITTSGRESALHREAKDLFEYELEKPGGIPSVQALLLLGDLECGVGRDSTGWMYAGEYIWRLGNSFRSRVSGIWQ